jgi:methylated-DNA-[protein]-cysteine S-methyltransferase
MNKALYDSPIGRLEILASDKGITEIRFAGGSLKKPRTGKTSARTSALPANPILAACVRELDEYFAGRRTEFTVPLDLRGTPFQKKVWAKLLKVPCGWTTTYGDLAKAVGKPGAARAVGGANHNNPVSIIVPCHRVVGSGGSLTGYGGGLERKRWLLEHERGS